MEKKLIWVDEKIAEEFEKLSSVEAAQESIEKIIKQRKLDMSLDQEQLSDAIIMFKSYCLSHKKALEEAYKEQESQIYRLWEECGDISSTIHKQTEALVNSIKPIQQAITDLKTNVSQLRKEVASIDIPISQKLVNLASSIAEMDDKTKTVLKALLNRE